MPKIHSKTLQEAVQTLLSDPSRPALVPALDLIAVLQDLLQCRADLEAVGAGGVGPLMRPDGSQEIPEGWKLAPVEPTLGMIEAGQDAHYEAEKRIQEPGAWEQGGFAKRAVRAAHVFQAMLDAAPAPPALEHPHVGKEPDWQDMYLKEKRRVQMWIAKYNKDIGKLGVAVPVAAQPQVEQEPVAYRHRSFTWAPWEYVSLDDKQRFREGIGQPLYTHQQPPRQPLTYEQIVQVLGNVREQLTGNVFLAFARAIERAHGIGGEA